MNPFRWFRDLRAKLASSKIAQAKAIAEIHQGIADGELLPDTIELCMDEISINVKKRDTKPIVGGNK